MVWHLYGEQAENRLTELCEYTSNFPDSPLVPIFQKEIEYIKYLREHGADPGGREWVRLSAPNN